MENTILIVDDQKGVQKAFLEELFKGKLECFFGGRRSGGHRKG